MPKFKCTCPLFAVPPPSPPFLTAELCHSVLLTPPPLPLCLPPIPPKYPHYFTKCFTMCNCAYISISLSVSPCAYISISLSVSPFAYISISLSVSLCACVYLGG